MILSLDKQDLVIYTSRQLEHFFPDNSPVIRADIERRIDLTLDRVNVCFSAVQSRYFQADSQARFSHLHSDQYAMFLFFLANTLYKEQSDLHLCEKLFYLNKLLNGIDAFYEVELPDIFLFSHPLGTVLGRAQYSNFFLVHQDVTVGAARESEPGENNTYPVLGEYCALYKGATILGSCHVGKNCKISAHSLLIDQNLADNQIYFGSRLNHVVKENRAPDNIWGREPAE
jgi:serine O-acetyltransferase